MDNLYRVPRPGRGFHSFDHVRRIEELLLKNRWAGLEVASRFGIHFENGEQKWLMISGSHPRLLTVAVMRRQWKQPLPGWLSPTGWKRHKKPTGDLNSHAAA
jgi:hypothetical protein